MKTVRFVAEICELVLKTLVPNERVTLVGGGRVWQDVAEDAAGQLLGGAWAALGGAWAALGWFWAADLAPQLSVCFYVVFCSCAFFGGLFHCDVLCCI